MTKLNIPNEFITKWQEEATWECKICGCTQNNACPEGCYWVEKNLCSVCARNTDSIQDRGEIKNE